MMELTISMLIGYLLGSLNPAAWIAAIKKKNLRESGTKNLGATNATLAFGKKYGAFVMVIDILKAFVAVKISNRLFTTVPITGLVAGCFAMIGHIFPIYLKFKGGKGLAAFGGMILAVDTGTFLILLTVGIVLMLITNYGVAMPFSVAILAPIISGLRTQSIMVFGMMLIGSALIIFKHWENIAKLKDGTEMRVKDFMHKR